MKKLIKSLVLLAVAVILSVVLLPVGVLWTIGEILVRMFNLPLTPSYKRGGILGAFDKSLGYLSATFHSVAVGLDQIGNAVCRDMLNRLLIEKEGYKFWKVQETISSVLGKNQKNKSLTLLWTLLVAVLDWIDPEHCRKAIKDFIC